MKELRVAPGRPAPLGVQDCHDGFNFAVFSRHAERIELLLYDDVANEDPLVVIDLGTPEHRTGDVWHAQVTGVRWGQAYAFRAFGPWEPNRGLRFEGSIELLDPRALAVRIDPRASPGTHRHRSLLVDRSFDWQGTTHPRRPWSDTLIYEAHVRGLTIDRSSGVAHPGTFPGVVEKLPHLLALGVTAIELMPVQAFDDLRATGRDPASGRPLHNYWGYDPIALFAPHHGYAYGRDPGSEVREFKTMVRELHRHDVEVILDMVFNHTAEGGERGPTFSFRGLDDSIYYLHGNDLGSYIDDSGCGNTLNCNHPVVRDYIIDCLGYWASDMGVDGFRFDLASILGRDENGRLMANAPLLERIAEDPVLRGIKLIAEAWDAAGAYQVGCFAGARWAEWNGRFRDDVRRFWRGDTGMAGSFAMRLCGSADLYERSGKAPVNSINFVTSHDGLTLNDVVSYAVKHNLANGEGNRDGADQNFSANHGVEGKSDDVRIERMRVRQIKNLLATLALSRGVPMLLGGDEFRRTQSGNNNPWCQDNAVSWYDWQRVEQHAEIVRFTREVMACRKRYPTLSVEAFYPADQLHWFAPGGEVPDWYGATHAFGCLVRSESPTPADGNPLDDAPFAADLTLCMLFNAGDGPVEFCLPPVPAQAWQTVMDTSLPAPNDICGSATTPLIPDPSRYTLAAHALAMLCSGTATPGTADPSDTGEDHNSGAMAGSSTSRLRGKSRP